MLDPTQTQDHPVRLALVAGSFGMTAPVVVPLLHLLLGD